jgi:hypothetical protein
MDTVRREDARRSVKFSSAGAVALATAVCMLALVPAGSVSADPPRLNIAQPTPTPTASPKAPLQLDQRKPVGTLKTLDPKAFRLQRLSAVGRGKTRTFLAPAVPVPSARQDVVVGKAGKSVALSCSRLPLQIQRVQGDVTPSGILTITGACFGSSGRVLMAGKFYDGPSIELAVQSWTQSAITAKVPYISGSPDQIVQLRLQSLRANISSALVESAPVPLNFVATRDTIDVTNTVANISCAQGAGPQGPNVPNDMVPDSCFSSQNGAECGPTFEIHRCSIGWHFRAVPGNGADHWSLRLRKGFHLTRIDRVFDDESQFSTNTNGIVFDPQGDPAIVTWTVNWQAGSTDYRVERADGTTYVLFKYADGTYMLRVSVTGPQGTWN